MRSSQQRILSATLATVLVGGVLAVVIAFKVKRDELRHQNRFALGEVENFAYMDRSGRPITSSHLRHALTTVVVLPVHAVRHDQLQKTIHTIEEVLSFGRGEDGNRTIKILVTQSTALPEGMVPPSWFQLDKLPDRGSLIPQSFKESSDIQVVLIDDWHHFAGIFSTDGSLESSRAFQYGINALIAQLHLNNYLTRRTFFGAKKTL